MLIVAAFPGCGKSMFVHENPDVADTGNSIYDHFNCLLMRLDGHGSMAFFPSRLVRLQRYEEE